MAPAIGATKVPACDASKGRIGAAPGIVETTPRLTSISWKLAEGKKGGATTTQIVNVGLAVVLAVIVYVALVLALRIVTRDDLALLPKGEKLARILHVR